MHVGLRRIHLSAQQRLQGRQSRGTVRVSRRIHRKPQRPQRMPIPAQRSMRERRSVSGSGDVSTGKRKRNPPLRGRLQRRPVRTQRHLRGQQSRGQVPVSCRAVRGRTFRTFRMPSSRVSDQQRLLTDHIVSQTGQQMHSGLRVQQLRQERHLSGGKSHGHVLVSGRIRTQSAPRN